MSQIELREHYGDQLNAPTFRMLMRNYQLSKDFIREFYSQLDQQDKEDIEKYVYNYVVFTPLDNSQFLMENISLYRKYCVFANKNLYDSLDRIEQNVRTNFWRRNLI